MTTGHARPEGFSPQIREEVVGRERRVGGRHLPIYKNMLVMSFIASAAIIVVLTILTFSVLHSKPDAPGPFLPVIVFAGSLGALFSALIRLYDFTDLPKVFVERELSGLKRGYLIVYSLIPVFVGAISATILYVIFASELIIGTLFPAFVCKVEHCQTFLDVVTSWSPNGPTDYSKAIVWAFIAGFAERLVPNTLRSLSRSMEQSESGTRFSSNGVSEPRP